MMAEASVSSSAFSMCNSNISTIYGSAWLRAFLYTNLPYLYVSKLFTTSKLKKGSYSK